jgi:hypothetical protein
VVIYDELEADHPAEWSWLIHNDNKMRVDQQHNTIEANNDGVKSRVSLFSSSSVAFELTDQFSVPVDNWTNKINEDGDTVNFINQWHFKAVSTEKKEKMRYLAIIQVKPDGSFQPININKVKGVYTLGNWNISAEIDASKPASIKAWNEDGTRMLVSVGKLESKGKSYEGKEIGSAKLLEVVDGKSIFQEVLDELPGSINRLNMMNLSVSNQKK